MATELTSFPKYQKPYWIIKMCLYWGTYFWQKQKTENRAALVELTQNEGLFHSLIFSKSFPLLRLQWESSFAATSVIFTREPVITPTALQPSGHTFSILQACWHVNVSVAGCQDVTHTHTHARTHMQFLTVCRLLEVIFNI